MQLTSIGKLLLEDFEAFSLAMFWQKFLLTAVS
jgi:hypothetical protein